jgi:hypothetical protein
VKTFNGTVKFDHSPGNSQIGRTVTITNPLITPNTTFTFSLLGTGDSAFPTSGRMVAEPYVRRAQNGSATVVQPFSTQYGHYEFNYTGINP